MNYSAINPKKFINCTVQLILKTPGLWEAFFSTRTQSISKHLREPKCRFSCLYRHLCFCLHFFPSDRCNWALFLWGMKVENCSTVPKRPYKIGMCSLGTLTSPQGRFGGCMQTYTKSGQENLRPYTKPKQPSTMVSLLFSQHFPQTCPL